MANLALIRGERDVAPKYLDIGKAFSEPFLDVYNKSVVLREQQKEVVKQENEIRAKDYASIDTIDLAQVGEDLLEATTLEANNIRNQAFELIKNKSNIGDVEYKIGLANLKKDVADLKANIKIKKILGTDYADADKIGQAPWGNNVNKQALLAAIDRGVKKDWIKKDGKYFLSTDGGKTLIDLSNITPPETIDYGIGISIEENAQKMLKNKIALGQRLTDQNITDTADLQIRSMNPSQIKSAALHFNIANNFSDISPELLNEFKKKKESGEFTEQQYNEAIQKEYYANKSLDQVTADVRSAMVDRLKGIQQGLNAKLDAINTPKLSAAEEKARREENERLKRLADVKNKFTRETVGLFNLKRNKEGVIIGGQLDNISINTESSQFKKLINKMGYSIGARLGEEDNYRGTEIIKQGTNKKYEILNGESLSSILSTFLQAEGGTFAESDIMGQQGVQTAENINVVRGGVIKGQQFTEQISNAGIKGPSLFGPNDFPEEFEKLSTESKTLEQKYGRKAQTGREKKIISEINSNYDGNFSDINVAKVKFDLFEREERNKKMQKEFSEETQQDQSLKQLENNFNRASNERVPRNELNKISSKEKTAIRNFIGKPVGEITQKELAAYEYNKAGGNGKDLLASNENRTNKLNNLNT